MFRTTVLKSLRVPIARPAAAKLIGAPRTAGAFKPTFLRTYAGFPALTREIARERILEVLEGYDKTFKDKEVTDNSSFVQDLGLDSLDVVEVVMEIEQEFNIEIPDNEADNLKTVGQAVDFVVSQPDAC